MGVCLNELEGVMIVIEIFYSGRRRGQVLERGSVSQEGPMLCNDKFE